MRSDPVVDGNVGLAYITVVRAFCSLFPDELHPGSFTTEQPVLQLQFLCGLQKKLRVVSERVAIQRKCPLSSGESACGWLSLLRPW